MKQQSLLFLGLLVGVDIFVKAWNNHKIPGKGIPINLYKSNNKTFQLDSHNLFNTDEAMKHYAQITGNKLKKVSAFGADPFGDCHNLKQNRLEAYKRHLPSYETIFHNVVNGDYTSFKNAIFFFINFTAQRVDELQDRKSVV